MGHDDEVPRAPRPVHHEILEERLRLEAVPLERRRRLHSPPSRSLMVRGYSRRSFEDVSLMADSLEWTLAAAWLTLAQPHDLGKRARQARPSLSFCLTL